MDMNVSETKIKNKFEVEVIPNVDSNFKFVYEINNVELYNLYIQLRNIFNDKE